MNTEQFKSLVRHALTFIGMFLTVLGVDKFIPLVEYLQENLDGAVLALTTIVGLATTIWGFFKDSERWKSRTE
jgi:hypothetical protein